MSDKNYINKIKGIDDMEPLIRKYIKDLEENNLLVLNEDSVYLKNIKSGKMTKFEFENYDGGTNDIFPLSAGIFFSEPIPDLEFLLGEPIGDESEFWAVGYIQIPSEDFIGELKIKFTAVKGLLPDHVSKEWNLKSDWGVVEWFINLSEKSSHITQTL